MSSVGTAKKFAWAEVLRSFWKADSEIGEENIEPIEKIDTALVGLSEKDLEELKKSSKRVNVLEERYGIEPKNLKTKKSPRAKTAKIEVKNIEANIKETQKSDEEREL